MTKKSPEEELVSKVRKSPAAQSLEMEQAIAKHLQHLKWEVVHGCYYTDIKEGKVRELDVVGEQIWARSFNDINPEVIRLHTVIECKSAKGYHLIFAPGITNRNILQIHAQWIGKDDDEHRIRLAEILNTFDLNKTQVARIINHYNRIAFDDDEVNSGERLHIDTFPCETVASAFRESNIGSEKELETSVMWKAGLALRSAVLSLHEDFIAGYLDDIKIEGKLGQMYGDVNLEQAIMKYLTLRSNLSSVYHPIIIIDCMLWKMKGTKFERVNWCRFKQSDIGGFGDWWFDIVSYEYFETYLTELTTHYRKQLLEIGAKRKKL